MDYHQKSKEEFVKELESLQKSFETFRQSHAAEVSKLSSLLETSDIQQSKYRSLSEKMTDIIWEINADMVITYINPAIKNISGFLPSEMIGRIFLEFIEPSFLPNIKEKFISRQNIYNEKGPVDSSVFEFKQIVKNGDTIWVETVANPVFDDKGNIKGFQGVTRDISDWKKANEELIQSRERLSKIFNSAPFAISILRISDFQIIEVNDAVLAITGYSKEEFLNKEKPDIYVWSNPDEKNKYLDSISRHEKLVHFEIRYKTKNGELGNALLSTEYITLNNEICLLSYFEVVTRHKKTLELLEESQEKYIRFSEAAFDAIFISEKEICLEQNYQAQIMFGYSYEEAVGRPATDWIAPEDRDVVMNHILNAYEQPYQVTALRKDGSRFPALIRARTMKYNDKTLRVTSLSDISEQKIAEQKLIESEKHFRLLFENSNDAIFWAEASTGKLIKCNKAAERLVERSQEEIIGQHHSILHPAETFELRIEQFNEHIQQKGSTPFESDAITKSGKIKTVEISSTVITIDGIEINQGIFKDISDKKRMEEALLNLIKASSSNDETGVFPSLVMHLAKALQVKYAFVGQVLGTNREKIKTIAYCKDFELAENIEYNLINTPCLKVFELGKCIFPKNVAQIFPKDLVLQSMGIESYMGVLLNNSNGLPMGIIVVMHNNEMLQSSESESILSLFAYKAASELERKQSKDELIISEQRLKRIADATFEGLGFSENGIIIDANQQLAQMHGYTVDEMIGMQVQNLIAPESIHLVEQNINFNLQGTYQYKSIRKDGSIFDVETLNKMIELNNKMLRVSAVRDISEYKKNQDALSESRANLLALVENTRDNIWAVDKDYRIIFINEHFKTDFKLGYGIELLPGMKIIDILPDGIKESWKSRYDRAFADERYEFEEHLVFGEVHIYVEVSMSPILVDGKIIGVSVFAHDVTPSKLAEIQVINKNIEIENQNKELIDAKERLKLSEVTYKGIIDSISEAVYIQNFNGEFLEVNRSVEKFYGYEKEFLIGKTPVYLSADEKNDLSELALAIEKTIKGESQTFEFWGKRKDGTIFPKEVNTTLGNYFGQKVIIAVAREISERKQAELIVQEKNKEIASQNAEFQQLNEELIKINLELTQSKEKAEESDRLKTSFLQNMSHEIRTPMNAIMGFSSLLVSQYNDKPKLEQYSEIISSRCSDLLDIINDILDIAKIESGQTAVNIEEFDLNFLFMELMSFFKEHQRRIRKDHIQFNLAAMPTAAENMIKTDKVKLKQIFINLIGNSFKFTESGKIEGGCYKENNMLVFYLVDTGIGIPNDKIDYIFERFAQLSHGQNKIYGGTGLGLSIVKGLIKILGGNIWVESEPGKGSTFYFTIPYLPANSAVSNNKNNDEFQQFHFDGDKILIVEDDLYNAEYLKEILSMSGFSVTHTIYGKEAIKLAIKNDFKIVLMDIRLPDIDGYEATRQIKKLKPELIIIAQTAYAATEDKIQALNSGCDDYISKPVKSELLYKLITKYINQL